MMKQVTKYSFGLGFFALALSSGSFVSAHNGVDHGTPTEARGHMQETRQATPAEQAEQFCARLGEHADTLKKKLTEQKTNFERHAGTREENYEEKQDNHDAALEAERSEADQRRTAMYTELRDQTRGDKELDAVKDFERTVEDAVSKRREAVNQAIDDFREGVERALEGRKEERDRSVKNFETAIDRAVEKAKAACEGKSATPSSIRATFQSDLKAARVNLQSERQASERVGAQVKTLAQQKKTTIDRAVAEFRATLEQAREELKAAIED